MQSTDNAQAILSVENLRKSFSVATGWFSPEAKLHAVQNVSFSMKQGETLGIVGESGCGKSTLGRTILNLMRADEGKVVFEGKNLPELNEDEMRSVRADVQIIFQDPLASLNPRMTVGDIIADPLRSLKPELSKGERRERVVAMMEAVGLLPEMINRYPHEFSGGQAQRIGIARALVSEPKLIVCDEPVSALDVSIQAQILNLLTDLKDRFNLSLIFISHDLSVVQHISDRIMVLYLGEIVELAPSDLLYENPVHPYTRSLLRAIPIPDPKIAKNRFVEGLTGEVPSPLDPPSGCAFRTRCNLAQEKCSVEKTILSQVGENRFSSCHFSAEL